MAVKKMLEPCGNDFTPSAKNKQVCDNCGFIKRKHICNCGCGLGLGIAHLPAVHAAATAPSFTAESAAAFAARIHPRNFNFSPKLAAIVGAIIGHDYGVRDRKGGHLTGLSITSDGFVIASSTASDGGGALLCDAEELDANLSAWLPELAAKDQTEFNRLRAERVRDWRS
jgi:hypothetical protein